MRLHDLPNGLYVTANGTDHWHESLIRKEQAGEGSGRTILTSIIVYLFAVFGCKC